MECSSLTSVGGTGSGASVEIPDSVTNIEPRVFQGCINLSSIEIPDSVTSIGENAFDYCINLSSIEIPNSVTSIGSTAFWRCSSLESVKILGSVTGIEAATFADCSSLSSIEIPNSVTSIGPWAFYNCNNLDTLQIVISSNQKYQFPTVGQDAFTGLPDSKVRNDIIIKKGTGLTDDDLKAADVASAFNEAEGADGLNDSLWYGWSYKGLPEVKDTHKVTITVQKDGTQWTDHGRTFALTKDGGTTLVTNLDAVEAGNYEIVDVTDSGNKLNTGVTVTVADADVPSTDPVNYYTVAFCYLDDDGNEQTYGDSTDWKPQTILKTVGRVAEPVTNPTKADHTFDKWITARGGNDAFAFGTTPITAAGTKIYAKWTQTTVPTHKVTITVQKDDAPWTHNDRTFALTKDGGTTLVTNLDAVEAGNYEIYDVTDSGKKLDTGVTVTVADTDVSSDPVEYYTVAFCYLDDDGNEQTYGDSTDWKPQTILKTVGRVTKPATNPTKADHTFDKWVTASNGETAFAFETTPITAKDTKIYAKWTENTVTTYHTVTFYDGDVPYGADTPQRPQRVADGQMADEPEAPQKAGWEFAGWKTTDGGSTPYDFDTPVTGDISIYASWVEKTVVDSLRIQATATEGGTIAPKGEIIVSKGGERTFTITPDEGNKIKAVTVDGKDVTAELKETRARAQTGARYYTFTNIVQNHTIHAEFERDGGSSGGGGGGDNPDPSGDNPGGGDNPNPGGGSGGGGGDNPDPGNDDDNKKPGSGGGNAGGGDNGGGNTNSGGGNNGGGTNPDGGNGAGNTANADTGNGAGNGQTVTGTAVSSAQAGSGAAAASAGSNTAFDGSKAAGGSTSGVAGTAANGKEPKTGDASYLEVYATLAMIAGLTYLLLYVMEESRGMSEREKEAFVAAFIRWGKKGGAFRKCCAMAAIFCLLAYYHIIGKNVGENALREKHLGQAF